MNNVRYCGRQGQLDMEARGWMLMLPLSCRETPEEIFERLSRDYSKVKVYWDTTAVRGYHEYFAFVKI